MTKPVKKNLKIKHQGDKARQNLPFHAKPKGPKVMWLYNALQQSFLFISSPYHPCLKLQPSTSCRATSPLRHRFVHRGHCPECAKARPERAAGSRPPDCRSGSKKKDASRQYHLAKLSRKPHLTPPVQPSRCKWNIDGQKMKFVIRCHAAIQPLSISVSIKRYHLKSFK